MKIARQMVFVLPAILPLVLGFVGVVRADVVYTNFGSGGAFDVHNGLGIGPTASIAERFTPANTVTFDDAIIGMGSIGSSPQMVVSLESDSGGFPGSILEQFVIGNLPPLGTGQTAITANSVLHPVLTAGNSYWLELSNPNGPTAIWNHNSIGDVVTGTPGNTNNPGGNEAITSNPVAPGGPWQGVANGETRGVFQIDGTLVPEPSTLGLLTVGAIGLLARRRFTLSN